MKFKLWTDKTKINLSDILGTSSFPLHKWRWFFKNISILSTFLLILNCQLSDPFFYILDKWIFPKIRISEPYLCKILTFHLAYLASFFVNEKHLDMFVFWLFWSSLLDRHDRRNKMSLCIWNQQNDYYRLSGYPKKHFLP